MNRAAARSYLACTHGRLAIGGCARKQLRPQWRQRSVGGPSGVPMRELIVAAGYLRLEEAELQDAPQPPAPVQVGISTEGLTIDQVRQLEGFATFLRAQNGPGAGEPA